MDEFLQSLTKEIESKVNLATKTVPIQQQKSQLPTELRSLITEKNRIHKEYQRGRDPIIYLLRIQATQNFNSTLKPKTTPIDAGKSQNLSQIVNHIQARSQKTNRPTQQTSTSSQNRLNCIVFIFIDQYVTISYNIVTICYNI